MAVHLDARAIEAVARVAKNFDLELQAVKLRTRAEARLGEMIEQGERDGILAKHGGHKRKEEDSESESSRPAVLKEIGVDSKLSARARKLNGIGAQAVAAMLDRMEAESRRRGRVATNLIDAEIGKRNADSRRQLARELSDCAAFKSTGRKFACLYADPAWKRKAGIGNRAYENHYVTMTWADILAMPVADRLLPDAWGFVWIPRAHLLAPVETEIDTPLGRCRMNIPLAWAIQIKWGFDSYSTCAVWTKTDEECPEDHGTGLVFFDQDELLLVFKRGRGLPKPDTDKKYGSNHRERAGDHSAKPRFYRDMINDMTGIVPTLELFAREDDAHPLPPNFFTWGNESKNTAEQDEPIDPETGEILSPTPSARVIAQDSPHPQDSPEPFLRTSPLADDEVIPKFLRRKTNNEVSA